MSAKKGCVLCNLTYKECDGCTALELLGDIITSIGSMIDTEKKWYWGIILNVILSFAVKTKTYPFLIKPVFKKMALIYFKIYEIFSK